MAFLDLSKQTVKEQELETSKYWKKIDLLNTTYNAREGEPVFIFYDGPPTANGNPGIHHVISRTLKDMTCRYKTMKGFQVQKKAGWDTHGLPVEIEVEKRLGLHNKKDIEAYGIEAFNNECKNSVFTYREQWVEMSDRMAFLADMDNPYVTLDNDYIETEWHLLNNFFERGLIYKGAKILPYCPRCGTGLASHEVALGYQEDEVTTVFAKFKRKDADNEYFLAWTTTPWTLPSNVALTVHPDVDYVKVKEGDTYYWAAKELVASVMKGEYEVVETVKGKDLEYVEYEQLIPELQVSGKAFYITCADYVTTGDGTGIVHTAPAFGEDDYNTGRRYDLPLVNPVDDQGKFTTTPWKDSFVMDADPAIIQYLRENDKMYAKQKITHNYPHCWRCHTPLIYYSRPSWYIEVTKLRDKMVENNNGVNWFPDFIGEKRFGNWLENLNDWAISRSRYWGTPLPIWKCDDCGHTHSIGSRKQLAEEAIEDIDENIELHRPYVDDVHLTCSECGGRMTREPDVIDVWFDSGSMPFSQQHYPFEHEDDFDKYYPADFICEGIDQTRGWFYSLMAISTLYKGIAPYKNVLVNDLVLDKDGIKMSKSRGNTINPFEVFDDYGADAVRFYSLYVSPPWLPTRFDVKGIQEVNSKFFRTVKNVYAMFALYANTNEIDPQTFEIPVAERPEIDRWLLSKYQTLLQTYHREMEIFEYTKVVRAISDFVVEDLSNWYIRRNRRRFWSSEDNLDTRSVFRTTYEVLLGLAKMCAPITPFLAEEIYQALTHGEGLESVHIEHLPEVDESAIDLALEDKMDLVRTVVNLGRASREDAGIKVRQPLSDIVLDKSLESKIADLVPLIEEELNVKDVIFSEEMDDLLAVQLKPDFKVAGKILGAKIKAFQQFLTQTNAHTLLADLQEGPVTLELNGEDTEILREYVQASYRAKEGYDVAMDGKVSVILDTELNDALLQEGYMREFVSKVQQQRKANGYEVTDRIVIRYDGDETLQRAFETYRDAIAQETLATSMTREEGLAAEPVDLNDKTLRFEIEKAS